MWYGASAKKFLLFCIRVQCLFVKLICNGHSQILGTLCERAVPPWLNSLHKVQVMELHALYCQFTIKVMFPNKTDEASWLFGKTVWRWLIFRGDFFFWTPFVREQVVLNIWDTAYRSIYFCLNVSFFWLFTFFTSLCQCSSLKKKGSSTSSRETSRSRNWNHATVCWSYIFLSLWLVMLVD